nr:hypothetical protein [Tanacetum cinerariifolium]
VLDQNVEEEVKDAGFVAIEEEDTETLHASADKPALSDPLDHLQVELGILNTKIDQLKSSISKKVVEDIKSSIPLDKDSIKSFVSESISEELLQKELSTSLHNKMRKSIKLKQKSLKRIMLRGEKWEKNNPESPAEEKDAQQPDQTKGEQDSETTTVAIVQGKQPSTQVVPNAGQAPPINKEKALVLHTSKEKSSEEDTSGKKIDDEPSTKKLKFLIPPSLIHHQLL